jgi:hypothetical protein
MILKPAVKLTPRRNDSKAQRVLGAAAGNGWMNTKLIQLRAHLSLLGAFALQYRKIAQVCEGVVECCGSTQLSLANCHQPSIADYGSIVPGQSKSKAASSRSTP